MEVLDIAELAKRTGIPASTLRYYDERGLIRSIGRRGARRLFDGSVLDVLALITMGQSAGFSLAEIATIFGPDRQQLPRAHGNPPALLRLRHPEPDDRAAVPYQHLLAHWTTPHLLCRYTLVHY